MTILVTGGSGLIGRYLYNYLEGVYVTSTDYDLTKEDQVDKMYQTIKPDAVIHLAAKVGGIMDNIAKPFEYLEENVLMNTNVVKYARKHEISKFVGVLSSCIYPDVVDHYPLREEDLHSGLPNASNFGYGYAKRLLGVHIDIARKEGLNYSYVIPSNLYGEYEQGDMNTKHFVGALLDKIYLANKNGSESITLYGDGTPLRQFTFARDVAEILALIVEYDIKDNMNISTPDNFTIAKLANLALQATDSQHLRINYDKSKPNGQHRKDVDIKVFEKNFPNYEFTSYIDGVRMTYEALKEKYER